MTTIESDPKIETKPKATRPKYGPRLAGSLMTAEEFDALPPSGCVKGYRYEVINGVLVVTPRSAMRKPIRTMNSGTCCGPTESPTPAARSSTRPSPSRSVPTPNRRRCRPR